MSRKRMSIGLAKSKLPQQQPKAKRVTREAHQ